MSRSIRTEDECWSYLEGYPDASAVVTRRMEVLYLNLAARSLVPPRWQGLRCWEVFPVRDRSCASKCPAIRAVQGSEEIFYCEEDVYPEKVARIRLGVAVIPLEEAFAHDARAILLLRPKTGDGPDEEFRLRLLADAEALRESLS